MEEGPVPWEPEHEEGDILLNTDRPSVWEMPYASRQRLHRLWLEDIQAAARKRMEELAGRYEAAQKRVAEVKQEIQLALLRKCRVLGMTTTAAARHHSLLMSLKVRDTGSPTHSRTLSAWSICTVPACYTSTSPR